MIDRLTGNADGHSSGKILKMVENPRMGGSVPAWVKPDTAQDEITDNFVGLGTVNPSFKSALSYQVQEPSRSEDEEFGFYDLLDMINPLQHIPLVNIAYRELTGDEIKSAPMVIGGAIFGGPVGAAGGLVNAIVKEETGKDIAGNALALVRGDTPKFKKHLSDNPEQRLAAVLSGEPTPGDLPVSLLAFTDNGMRSGFKVEKQSDDAPPGFSPYEIY